MPQSGVHIRGSGALDGILGGCCGAGFFGFGAGVLRGGDGDVVGTGVGGVSVFRGSGAGGEDFGVEYGGGVFFADLLAYLVLYGRWC